MALGGKSGMYTKRCTDRRAKVHCAQYSLASIDSITHSTAEFSLACITTTSEGIEARGNSRIIIRV